MYKCLEKGNLFSPNTTAIYCDYARFYKRGLLQALSVVRPPQFEPLLLCSIHMVAFQVFMERTMEPFKGQQSSAQRAEISKNVQQKIAFQC